MQPFTSARLTVQQHMSSHLLSLQAIAFKHKYRAPKVLEDLKKKKLELLKQQTLALLPLSITFPSLSLHVQNFQ